MTGGHILIGVIAYAMVFGTIVFGVLFAESGREDDR